MATSIAEKIKLFVDAAESLQDDIDPDELANLAKDIKESAGKIWDYMKLIEDDAARLKTIALKHADLAAQQTKKAKRLKDYLKYALKSNGFTKLTVDGMKITMSETKKYFAKRPATMEDILLHEGFVTTAARFSGEYKPTISDAIDHPYFFDITYDWDVDALKTAEKTELLEVKTIDTIRVTIEKAE